MLNKKKTNALLLNEKTDEDHIPLPNDRVNDMIERRKNELDEHEFYDHRDPNAVSKLLLINNMHEILELLLDVILQQQKTVSRYFED